MGETPNDARLGGIRQAVLVLERSHPSAPLQTPVEAASKESRHNGVDEQREVKKIVDRQIRVFFNVPGSSVAEPDASDSFYKLSSEEVSKEAKMRRERLEQSRLLIPKSYKEKQALAARQKYKQAVIRVQFPDGVTLQGVFLPAEATGSLYEEHCVIESKPDHFVGNLYPIVIYSCVAEGKAVENKCKIK